MNKSIAPLLLDIYREGKFPMADSRMSEEVYLYDPPLRGQLPVAGLHIPKRLKKTVLKAPYEMRVDTAFADVIDGCAASAPGRETTWINDTIRNAFVDLHEMGHAHSVETWQDGELVGGLYGLAVGGVFCGESMFSRATDASKIALVHLCARLWKAGFEVLDTQFVNEHLKQFGIYEVPRDEYLARLKDLRDKDTDFALSGIEEAGLVRDYLENR